jgi:YD repeat-containing protein
MFKYDKGGRVLEAVAPKASSQYAYGSSGELLEETNDAHSFKFEYDPTGLLLAINYPDKSRVTFEYDLDKRLARVSDWSGATTSFRQELDDRSAATSWPNGLSMTATLAASGTPLRTLTRNVRSGVPLYETLSTFDVQGRLASHADSEFGKRDYRYDLESQLLTVRAGTGEAVESFSHDPAGNRQSINGNSVVVGAGNRMLSTWNARCGGINRAGGELRPVIGADGQPTGDWIMDNSSSNSFARSDGTRSTPENLQASKQLLQESGMDTSNIQLQDWDGNSVLGD